MQKLIKGTSTKHSNVNIKLTFMIILYITLFIPIGLIRKVKG